MSFNAIAIDGPASAGKSTIAKAIANKLNYIYVDTGALYRGIGLYAARNGADTTNEQAVMPMLQTIQLELKYNDGAQRIVLNGEDVSEAIRTSDMAMHASNVSAMPCVRAFLLDLQRNIAKSNNIIMDGRDIGTVVLPHADVKIFLTASAEVRAKRRYDEHMAKGQTVDFDTLLAEIIKRDHNDSVRAAAPLKQAGDAILVDTSAVTLWQSIDMITAIITDYLNKREQPREDERSNP